MTEYNINDIKCSPEELVDFLLGFDFEEIIEGTYVTYWNGDTYLGMSDYRTGECFIVY